MGKISKGAPAKGCPPKGSWGDRYVIENTYQSKRISCGSCIHYREDDKSCEVEPIYVPENGYGYWKLCKYFELSPELADDIHSIDIVQRVKGTDYKPQKKKQKQETISISKKIFSVTLSQKQLYQLALQCPYFNRCNNHCKKQNQANYCSVVRNILNNKCMMEKRILKKNNQ